MSKSGEGEGSKSTAQKTTGEVQRTTQDRGGQGEPRGEATGSNTLQSHFKNREKLLCGERIRGGKRTREPPKGGCCRDPGQRGQWSELSILEVRLAGITNNWVSGLGQEDNYFRNIIKIPGACHFVPLLDIV